MENGALVERLERFLLGVERIEHREQLCNAQEIVKALATPDMRERLAQTGVNAESSTPEQLGRLLRSDVAKWAKIIKEAGIPIN